MSEAKPKRFYTDVSIVEDGALHVVQLDGRTAKTTGRHPLGANQSALAAAIAAEWSAQNEDIDLATMPLTRLQGFALDGGEGARAQWSDTILSYLQSDLLCYRAPDPQLAKRQADLWQPVLDRLDVNWGVNFSVTEGIIAVEQDPALITKAAELLSTLSPGRLYAIKLLTEMTGSAALALSIVQGDIDPEAAFQASRLDETFQAEQWGVDEEAAAREAALKRDFDDVVRFLTLSVDQDT